MLIQIQAAIGHTSINTGDYMVFADLDYRAQQKFFDPTFGKHNKTWSSDRLALQYEFYLTNTVGVSATPVIEIQCGNDIDKVEIWAWKNGAWDAVGTWGTGGTAWGTAGADWTDEDTWAHTPTADKSTRGATLGIGTVSKSLGCKYRVLFKLTNIRLQSGTLVSTKYGAWQLKLRVKITHTQRETLRPYPVITYIEGGMEQGAT